MDSLSKQNEHRRDRVTITLSPPPSVNRIWQRGRGGKVFRSRAYITWLRMSHLMAGNPGQIQGQVVIRIKIIGGRGWRKGRDIDNIHKPSIDFLVHSRIIEDDNWEIVRRVTISYHDNTDRKARSYIEIQVRRIMNENQGQNQGIKAS